MLASRIGRSTLLRAFPLLLVASAAACNASNDSSPASAPSGGASGVGGDGGADGSTEPVPQELSFVPGTTVQLAPKEIRQLTVKTTPPGSFRVRFALLGESSDAVLDTSEVQTAEDGIAQVTLTGPSKPTTFSVRAAVAGRRQALVGVAVSALGFTTLRVKPSYNGRRAVSEWTASVKAGVACADLSGNPPPDGDLAVTVPSDDADSLVVTKVPIGVALAITLRAGHFIGGCANQAPLSEGDGNQALVYVSDRPLNLSATTLDVSFGPSDPHPTFDALLKSATTNAEAAIVGAAGNDVVALLDQMSAATAVSKQLDFETTRSAKAWDAQLASAFGKGSARRLRDPVARWLAAGLVRFNATNTFLGTLGPQGSAARFTLTQVLDLSPGNAGFGSQFPATWSADSSDTLLVGTELGFSPSRLVTALAGAPALLEVPDASSTSDALIRLTDCAQVAQVLLAYGDAPGSAVYPSCDEACASATCQTAVTALWQRAQGSASASARLSVTASGSAEVGDDAEASRVRGSWLGELTLSGGTAPGSGAFSANASAP